MAAEPGIMAAALAATSAPHAEVWAVVLRLFQLQDTQTQTVGNYELGTKSLC